MNILFTFTWMFHPNKGGTERVTDILAREFKRRGNHVYYLNTVINDNRKEFEYPADALLYLPENLIETPKGLEKYHQILHNYKIDVVINQGGVMGTCKIFAQTGVINITVIHFTPDYGYNNMFDTLSTLRNRTVVEKIKRIIRVLDYFRRRKKLYLYIHDLYQFWSDNSTYICLLSHRHYQIFEMMCPEVNREKLVAIPNPNTYPICKHLDKKKVVIWVGRLELKQKRPDRMIKMWLKIRMNHPDWKLVMVGDGRDREYLEKLSGKDSQIEFTGFTDPLPYYQVASILCMTSTHEGWGMVLSEAMANGAVPLAFSSFESIYDLLQNEQQLVTPFDEKEYMDKLDRLMADDTLRERLRTSGYKQIQKYSVDNVCNQWERLIQLKTSSLIE